MVTRRAPKPPDVSENARKTKIIISSTHPVSKFNPAPEISKTMKEKIQIFNSAGPELRRCNVSAYDDKSDIKSGIVSEIIANFSYVEQGNRKKNQV